MLRAISIAVYLVLLGLAFVYASQSNAEPRAGDVINLKGTILCDKQEQIEDILTANQSSFEEALARATVYAQTLNEKGEAACTFVGQPSTMQLASEVSYFPDVLGPNGEKMDLWVVPVAYNGSGGVALGYIFLSWPPSTGVRPASL